MKIYWVSHYFRRPFFPLNFYAIFDDIFYDNFYDNCMAISVRLSSKNGTDASKQVWFTADFHTTDVLKMGQFMLTIIVKFIVNVVQNYRKNDRKTYRKKYSKSFPKLS